MKRFLTKSSDGEAHYCVWFAEDFDHAIEQIRDAFVEDEYIESLWQEVLGWRGLTSTLKEGERG